VSGVGGSNPGVSAGMSSSNRQGITYSVVSEGTIRITGTGADQTVLATLSRDANNRQIVTVNTSSNYSVSFSLNDFNNLTNLATSANSLIDALTAQIPGGIAAGGPDVESLYRDTMALGIPLSEFGPDPVATLTAQAAQERANAQADAYYDSLPDGPYPVPEHVTAAIQEGVGTIRSAVCQAWQMPVLPNKKLCTGHLQKLLTMLCNPDVSRGRSVIRLCQRDEQARKLSYTDSLDPIRQRHPFGSGVDHEASCRL
jgi:hypothetical protein